MKYWILVILVIVSGFTGGFVCNLIVSPKYAAAQENKEVTQQKNEPQVLTVKELRVVDDNGNLLAKIGKENGQEGGEYGLFIYEKEKKQTLFAGFNPDIKELMVFMTDNPDYPALMSKLTNTSISFCKVTGDKKTSKSVLLGKSPNEDVWDLWLPEESPEEQEGNTDTQK